MYIKELKLKDTIESLKRNEFSEEQLISKIIDRINESEDYVKALMPEKNRKKRLLSDLKQIKENKKDNENLPLFGIPVGIKDIIRVDGFETSGGSKLPTDALKGNEANIVKRFKNAGALILGKTVTTEFAYFEPGPTRNPHNINHTPGGSSSGSAAAVASGITPLAIGTQTIGSIIRPAAYCGIVGYKPSFDRIDKSGVIPFSLSADHLGTFTQDIEGVEIVAPILIDDWNEGLIETNNKPKIGVVKGNYFEQVNDEMKEFFNLKVEELKKEGYEVVETDLFGDIEKINKIHGKMTSAEFAETHEVWFNDFEDLYSQKSKELILNGKKVTIGELSDARLGRKILRNKIEIEKANLGIDIWLSPSTTETAPEGMATGSPLMNLPWTYAGLPVITIPAGKSKNNMPVGLQFSGSFWNDEQLLGFVKNISNNVKF